MINEDGFREWFEKREGWTIEKMKDWERGLHEESFDLDDLEAAYDAGVKRKD